MAKTLKSLTTNTVKVKERSRKNIKLNMLSTNETKPKGFNIKGKPAKMSPLIITTSNVGEFAAKRKKEIVKENRDAKARQKKLTEEIKVNKEKERLKELKLEGSIEKQIEVLDKRRKELEAKLGKR